MNYVGEDDLISTLQGKSYAMSKDRMEETKGKSVDTYKLVMPNAYSRRDKEQNHREEFEYTSKKKFGGITKAQSGKTTSSKASTEQTTWYTSHPQ